MNEYEYLFTQYCREKKRTASGARHRATRGKRSFTVHNPSDYLTKKQREELSSPVISFTAKPVTYEEFKAMDSVTISGDNKDTLADDLRRALTFVLPDHKIYKITIETI